MLSLTLADARGERWAQEQVIAHHYLHTSVDVRCRPLTYLLTLFGRRVGCLIFGRPEATKVSGWYGSVEDVLSGACPLSRWQVLNLARVYLDPSIQREGVFAHPDGLIGPSILPGFYDRRQVWHSVCASYVIDLALERVPFEYLYHRPPVWMDQPYELVHVLSYCNAQLHKGIIYQAARFERVRTNARGIQTYRRRVRPLTEAEQAIIAQRSQADQRAQRLRARASSRTIEQLPLLLQGEGW
jgi:hypothetical protein